MLLAVNKFPSLDPISYLSHQSPPLFSLLLLSSPLPPQMMPPPQHPPTPTPLTPTCIIPAPRVTTRPARLSHVHCALTPNGRFPPAPTSLHLRVPLCPSVILSNYFLLMPPPPPWRRAGPRPYPPPCRCFWWSSGGTRGHCHWRSCRYERC